MKKLYSLSVMIVVVLCFSIGAGSLANAKEIQKNDTIVFDVLRTLALMAEEFYTNNRGGFPQSVEELEALNNS